MLSYATGPPQTHPLCVAFGKSATTLNAMNIDMLLVLHGHIHFAWPLGNLLQLTSVLHKLLRCAF